MPTTITLRETSRRRPSIVMLAFLVFYASAFVLMAGEVGTRVSDVFQMASP